MESVDTTDSVNNAKKRRMEEPNEKQKDASTKKVSFGSLNSKLLTQIFSTVNLKELAALGSTCKKFNRIARKIFAENYRDELIEVRATDRLVKIAEILRCFQNQITKLALFYSEKSKANIKMDVLVDRYCRKSLAEMQFSDVGFYSSTRSFAIPFRSVTNLDIKSGVISGKLDEIATLFPNVMSIDFHQGVEPAGSK